jgi:hypothetical protein
MRNALGVLAVAAAGALGACAAPAEVTTATLALRTLPSCELDTASDLRLRASGDFRAIELDRKPQHAAPITLDQFPVATRYLAFEVGAGTSRAGGLMLLPAARADLERDVLLLPYATSCPLGDPLAVAARGAALAPLPEGGLLIAGGTGEDGEAVASARVLPAGEALVQEVPGGMLFRRAGASATLAGDRIVIAGGGQDDASTANDTFEIYDATRGTFDKALSQHFAENHARRDHGAALLGDGRVLLVGGCSRPGMTRPSQADDDLPRCTATGAQPLANAEWIDPANATSTAIDGTLAVARVQPSVLVLDSGTVLIALGWDEAGVPVPEVERFDPASGTFSDMRADLPEHASAAVIALEGDRVFYAGCDGANAECEIALLVPNSTAGFTRAELPDAGTLRGSAKLHDLEQVRLLALHDGRVLISGRSASTRVRRGFVVDLAAMTIDPADVSRVPDRLLELADGTRVEADSAGISLAREDAQSSLDDAPEQVVSNMASHLAPDLASRWHIDTEGMRASTSAAARADLPFLRFADLRVTLDLADGAAGTLLLERTAAPPTEVKLGARTIATGDCSIARDRTAALVIERHAGKLTLASGDHRASCDAPELEHGRVGIAVRLEPSALLRSLRVTRL